MAAVFKNSGICEYCSMLKAKEKISHSETSLLGKFYIHQENNALFTTKNVNFAFFFFPWTLLKKTLTQKVSPNGL